MLAAQERDLPSVESIDDFIDRELPFSVRGTFGGNTSCVEIATGGDEYVLCDLGTGVRGFGNQMMAQYGREHRACYNVFLSHVHWDHIMGFPFFAPAYVPGNTIRIHGCHKVLEEALRRQQSDPCFPVHFDTLGAAIEFVELEPGVEAWVAGFAVTPIKQPHSGDSYAYRFSRAGKSVVYSTDGEHKIEALNPSYPFVEFCRDVDLLIFDTMYSLADTISVKEDWGHSNNMVAVELAQMARVKRLVMFHHEPAFDDRMIERVLAETVRFEEISRDAHKVEVMSAFDGLELDRHRPIVPGVLAWLRAPGRAVALIVLVLATLAYATDPYLLRELRDRGFDAMQRIWPRTVDQPQVLIVGIDEASLKQFGQWPWPRTLVARLVDQIAACGAAGPRDRRDFRRARSAVAAAASQFRPEPSVGGDRGALRAAVERGHARPGNRGRADNSRHGLRRRLISQPAASGLRRTSPIVQKGGPPDAFLDVHRSMIHSLPEIAGAASSEASLGVELDDDGTVRSVPLVALVAGNLVQAWRLR